MQYLYAGFSLLCAVQQWSYTLDGGAPLCFDTFWDKVWEVEGAKVDEFASESIFVAIREKKCREKLWCVGVLLY